MHATKSHYFYPEVFVCSLLSNFNMILIDIKGQCNNINFCCDYFSYNKQKIN